MAVDKETFLSQTKKDFEWPYPKPLTQRPSQPPIKTKPNNYYVATLVEPYCHCDAHLYDPQMGRYRMLAEKEKMLHKELEDLNNQMAVLSSELLDHPCDTDDDKMQTIYQTDYTKRGLNLVQYKKLAAAVDSPVGVPVRIEQIGLGKGYRDPNSFRFSCFPRPIIDVCTPLTFNKTPVILDEWFAPRTGRSEYQDTVSKVGLGIMKSRQQYTEPLPSSRRRHGDPCL